MDPVTKLTMLCFTFQYINNRYPFCPGCFPYGDPAQGAGACFSCYTAAITINKLNEFLSNHWSQPEYESASATGMHLNSQQDGRAYLTDDGGITDADLDPNLQMSPLFNIDPTLLNYPNSAFSATTCLSQDARSPNSSEALTIPRPDQYFGPETPSQTTMVDRRVLEDCVSETPLSSGRIYDSSNRSSGVFGCKVCNMTLMNERTLKNHEMDKHGPFKYKVVCLMKRCKGEFCGAKHCNGRCPNARDCDSQRVCGIRNKAIHNMLQHLQEVHGIPLEDGNEENKFFRVTKHRNA
ncbi:hypothetical protein TWF730_002596 [Orbilia blumenaviensis]|uniref:C2H2-type domain-containing protein n=1 Tax=Orbilia blumenaviensis TaxID=1796055 RepID=A0AAV9UB45_9PEZI